MGFKEKSGHKNEHPGKGWFLVWVSGISEKPILIEHDRDVHNWEHLVSKVEGPFSEGQARIRALIFYKAWG